MRGVTESLAVSSGAGPKRVVPAYALPEDAVRALAAATRYGQWRARDHGELVTPEGIDRDAAAELIDAVLAEHPDGRALTFDESRRLLSAYGIRLWPRRIVRTATEAVAAARELGYPVILKTASDAMRHQVGASGVRLDLASADAVATAHESLTSRLGDFAEDQFAVQRMSPPGVACVLSTSEDPLFGPVVAFSVAGPPTDLLSDIG